MPRAAFVLGLLAALVPSVRAQTLNDLEGPAPVSVSSANYRTTPFRDLSSTINRKPTLNPAPRTLTPLAEPKYFVFVPGEKFAADVSYDSLCLLLTTALAQKNYLNAADPAGLIREPKKVSLVLRLNYGVTLWRNPIVRTEHLSWDEGLVGKVHDSRSLTHLGGDVVWGNRAGGNDEVFTALAQNESNPNSFWGSGGGTGSGEALASADDFGSTRDFNLIVVDAFDYAELKSKGKAAQTVWTTFIAAPVQRGQKFSQAVAAMLRTAAPYWGETTSGLQIVNDTRAEVRIGEAVEVKDSAPTKK